jgi:hypothetical protein
MIMALLLLSILLYFSYCHYKERGIQAALSYIVGCFMLLFAISQGLNIWIVVIFSFALSWIVRQLPLRAKQEVADKDKAV